ncbi:MAG: glycoside hydrolase family 2 TIM barrel-domain containing protein [Lachnospiraceae bacterium]
MKQLFTEWGDRIYREIVLPGISGETGGNPETENPDILPEYPRPQFQRADSTWQCLNGWWKYAIRKASADGKDSFPEAPDGRILVPFSPETALSGVSRQLQPDEVLWYQRKLPELPDLSGKRVILHFGAVDQTAWVFVNQQMAFSHTGGYLPFEGDITDALNPPGQKNLLTVKVRDLSDTSYHARGKQKLERGGMFYMATSGIWQTVWLEVVPLDYIREVHADADADSGVVTFHVDIFPADTADADPVQEDVIQTGSSRDGTSQTDPAAPPDPSDQSGPSQADSSRCDPAQTADPLKTDKARFGPAQTDSSRPGRGAAKAGGIGKIRVEVMEPGIFRGGVRTEPSDVSDPSAPDPSDPYGPSGPWRPTDYFGPSSSETADPAEPSEPWRSSDDMPRNGDSAQPRQTGFPDSSDPPASPEPSASSDLSVSPDPSASSDPSVSPEPSASSYPSAPPDPSDRSGSPESPRMPELPEGLRVIGTACKTAMESGRTVLRVIIPDMKLWTPRNPYLYYYRITFGEDTAVGYFAFRVFSVETDSDGIQRICLNHSPRFQKGVLDQGYWPESYYTAPSDEALAWDVRKIREAGFNMVRKHVKIEPDRWYCHCDREGLIVWQDMVCGGGKFRSWYVTYLANLISQTPVPVTDRTRWLLGRGDPAGRKEFADELRETIRRLREHPSIAVWVLFNEGWGQFDTKEMTELARRCDSTRLIDQASGWYDQGGGDLRSMHNYFFPQHVVKDPKRAFVLSEIGGIPLSVPEHDAYDQEYGYNGKGDTPEDRKLSADILMNRMRSLKKEGLCACVWTQWTDVEEEVNGIYTWDRQVKKL